MHNIRLIVNPTAGKGWALEVAKQASHLLDKWGLNHKFLYSRSPDDPARLAREAMADGAGAVVAIGGDGLVSQVAGQLVKTDTPLGIIPAGRGNDFARGLGIPLDIEGACATILTGNRRRIDVGQTQGTYFFSVAVIGFAAEINRKANSLRRLRANVLYSLLTIVTIFTDQPQGFTITYEGRKRRSYCWMIAVGNTGSSARGMALVPAARPDDGQLDACIINGMGKLELLLSVFPKVFRGRHLYHTGVDTIRGREMTVESDRPCDLYADGERIGRLPATLYAIPQALTVLVPAHSQR